VLRDVNDAVEFDPPIAGNEELVLLPSATPNEDNPNEDDIAEVRFSLCIH